MFGPFKGIGQFSCDDIDLKNRSQFVNSYWSVLANFDPSAVVVKLNRFVGGPFVGFVYLS